MSLERLPAPSSRYRTWTAIEVPAPIVVEIYAQKPPPQQLAALIAACSQAASPHECITSDVKTVEAPLGVAIVQREGDRARIELGLRSASSSEWSMRDLVFQPIDGELERHRAIGFAIGTLVARKVALPPPPPPVVVEQPPPLPPPAVAARAPVAVKDAPADDKGRGARGTWFDVQGGLGLGLIPGPPRVGALLRGAFEFSPGGFFAVAETGYAARPADASLRTRWWSLALGVGHPLLPRARSLGFDVRLLATVERLSLTATEGLRSGQEARFKPGGTIAVDARWDFLPALGCVLSVATFIDPERSVVRVGGEQVGETPAVGLNGFFGLRLRLR